MKFKPTQEQEKIFHFVKNRPENLLIEAYAGCGKSTVLSEIANILPKDKQIMSLSFNKHIQEELKEKLPEHIRCYTTYSLGLSAIKRKYGDKIIFDEFKVDKIITKKSKSWNLESEFKSDEDIHTYLYDLKKLVNYCRSSMSLTTDSIPYLIEKYDVNLNKNEDVKRCLKILDVMVNDRTTYDFTDMIFLPAIDNSIWMFPQDYVLLDECLPKYTYISTDIGKQKIETLFNKFKNNIELPLLTTYNETTKTFEYKKIKNIWSNGIKNIHQVILSGKRKLKSTVNHKFLTQMGWKRLDELKIGDAIISNYNNQPYHGFLDNSQKEIFIGSIIGDGGIQNLSNNINRIRVIHGKPQEEYLRWKASFFYSNVELIEKNGYSQKNAFAFNTLGYYFNIDKRKAINNITPMSLAIAWMDDGSLTAKNCSRLYSYANNLELITLLAKKLNNDFNIQSKIKTSKSSSSKIDYFYLIFNVENTKKISKLVSPYIHKSIAFKILECDRDNINEDNWIKYEPNNLGCLVVTKEHEFLKLDEVFDMSVEDNHNFIITSVNMGTKRTEAGKYGIIAHNCQDVNRCQIKIIEKILRKDKITGKTIGRLFSVGDKFQNIYNFNCSDSQSFQWFEKYQNTKVLPLSYSFRCAKNIIANANSLVKEIKALDTAPDGIVRHNGDVLKEAESGDFVLCRTTMPLVKLFFGFLMEHKKAVVKGSDIGINLIEMIGKILDIEKLKSHWTSEVMKFKNDLYGKGILNPSEHSGYVSLEDKVTVLLFLASMTSTVPELKDKIKYIFNDDVNGRGVILSTVHKAKGLEADRVFIIRPDLLPMRTVRKPWQVIEERNIQYVALTRAKLELVYDHEYDKPEEI